MENLDKLREALKKRAVQYDQNQTSELDALTVTILMSALYIGDSIRLCYWDAKQIYIHKQMEAERANK